MHTHRACIRAAIAILWAIASLGLVQRTEANPLFARQTGLNCSGCHTVYPELAPFGRKFKLAGYTQPHRSGRLQHHLGMDLSVPEPGYRGARPRHLNVPGTRSSCPLEQSSYFGISGIFPSRPLTVRLTPMPCVACRTVLILRILDPINAMRA